MSDSHPSQPDDQLDPAKQETVRHEPHKDTLADSSGSDFQHGRFEPGQRLGERYRIVSLLGKGGMGEVYRADDLELGQSVALKFLPERVAADQSWLRRFRNEVRTARQVAHANVCRIYDIGEEDGHVFLSMEYIDGEDLGGVLRRLGRPSREKAIEIARQICLGLAAAHENKVLHRDLKPANIMIDGRGRVRITDFGLAGFLDELEQANARAGTPAYMAPEQLTDGKVSVRSDIYTLGLVLHELFTGKCVFDSDDIEELKREHSSGTLSTPSSITQEIDPAVERVIMRCLQEEPNKRPDSVYQVLAALPGSDPLAAALAAGETPSPELVANVRETGGLRPAVALTLLALCFALIIWNAVNTDNLVRYPVKGPVLLSVEAEQAMQRLGYADLPANTETLYFPIIQNPPSGSDSERSAVNDDWPPLYGFWRRWSPGSMLPSSFHSPFAVDQEDPPLSQPGEALVVLDTTGRLLKVKVVPHLDAEPLDKTDFSAALAMLGIDESEAQSTEPIRQPEHAVDELRAWEADFAPDAVIQAGSVGGRIVYFEVIDKAFDTTPAQGRGSPFSGWFGNAFAIVTNIMLIILAIGNIRKRRSDIRGAIHLALLMAAFYLAIEVLSIRVHEKLPLQHILSLFNGRAAGHIALHGITTFIIYLAIEPYVRRLWPRLLVGAMRLASGRIKDPLVGREMLVGSLVGLALMNGILFVLGVTHELPASITQQLGPPKLVILGSIARPFLFVFFALGMALGMTVVYASMLVLARIVLRSNVAAVVAVSFLMALWLFLILFGAFGEASNLIILIPITMLAGAAVGATAVRSGLLSVFFIFTMIFASVGATFSLRMGEWYSANTMISAAIVLAFPTIGCWLSIAGQPIFKDVLAEPQAA